MSWTEEEREKWVEEQVKKFKAEMEAQGVRVDTKINDKPIDGEVEVEELKKKIKTEEELDKFENQLLKIKDRWEKQKRKIDPVSYNQEHGTGVGQIPLSGAKAPKKGMGIRLIRRDARRFT